MIPPTTAPPTTPPTTAPTTELSTTTTAPLPVAPLTGLPVEGEVNLDRPALVLKIDNSPKARPQTGLDKADIVFDYRAESVTRFTAVFHSRTPEPAGPVRSSRTSDFDLLEGLDNPLYGSSGGNSYVISALRNLPIYMVTNHSRQEYFREPSRPAPHNLYIDANDLFALAPADTVGPQPWFQYRPADADPPATTTATPATGEVRVNFRGGPTVGFTWDPIVEGWLRTQNGQPHVTIDGTQLAPANVLIMETSYRVSPADPISPELISTGSGPLVALSKGSIVRGTWERAEPTDKPTLLDTDGQPILLTAGQTWVLYPEAGQTTL